MTDDGLVNLGLGISVSKSAENTSVNIQTKVKERTKINAKIKSMDLELWILKYFPRIAAIMYILTNTIYITIYNVLMPLWYVVLGLIGLLYALRDAYLEGYYVINKKDFERLYPRWVKLHAVYGIDGRVKVKRRIIYESRD